MPADGLNVLITELAPPFRVMTFAGDERPEQPVAIEGSQRSVQTWYPGASRASTQVMGTKEEPVVLRGWFRNPLTILDGGAKTRIAVLRGLRDGGNLCQLIWGDVIIRKGRVQRVHFKFHRENIVRYEVTFEVDQADEVVALAPLTIVATVAQDLYDGLQAVFAALEVGADAVRAGKSIDAIV